jgi:AraC-like DNA-binding protein
MIFQPHIPRAPLDRFIEYMLYHEAQDSVHNFERFLPDGNVEIIIDLHDHAQFIYDNDSLKEIQACHHVWASGFRTEPITIPSGKASAMLIIGFRRGMAYPFFPVPMNEIVDCVVDADLLWGCSFADLREQILENQNSIMKFELVENFLIENFISRLTINPCVEFAVNTISREPDQVILKDLSQKVGYSQKHFISMFRNQVGVSPKEFLKIIRFQKAVNEIETTPDFDWSGIAADCGFYDQAHFINDFRHFSGFTPTEYARRRGTFLNYIPIG